MILSLVIQILASIIIGVCALLYRERLKSEMISKFKATFGKLFSNEKIFDSPLINWYLNFSFILFGVMALLFAFLASLKLIIGV